MASRSTTIFPAFAALEKMAVGFFVNVECICFTRFSWVKRTRPKYDLKYQLEINPTLFSGRYGKLSIFDGEPNFAFYYLTQDIILFVFVISLFLEISEEKQILKEKFYLKITPLKIRK